MHRFFLLLIFFAGGGMIAMTSAVSAGGYQAGQDSANSVNSKYGSKSGINERASKPITGAANMETVSGNQTFKAQMSCPSSIKFLEMTAIPTASGDVDVTIFQKTNFSNQNNSFDYIYTVPLKISGACANGFISCDAGTWVNCKYYAWSSGSGNLQAGITQTTMNNLGGCYCINNSCGYTLAASNYDLVLSSLGGGAVGSVLAANPQYAISKASVTIPTILYYGQAAADCAASQGGSGVNTPQQYYNPQNPNQLNAAGQSEASSQMGQSGSYYSMLNVLQTNSTGKKTVQACDITKGFDVSTEVVSVNKSGTGSMCIVSDISAGVMKRQGVNIYDVQFSSASFNNYPNCPSQAPLTVETFDKTALTLSLPANAVSPAIIDSLILHGSFTAWGCNSTPATITSPDIIMAISTCQKQDYHNGTYAYDVTLEYKYDSEINPYSDNCAQFASSPDCALKDEIEYDASGSGIYSYRNYNPTGLHVQPSAVAKTTSISTYSKTYQWWKLSRTYTCAGKGAYDFTSLKQRAAAIINSTSNYAGGGGSQSYNDLQCSNGQCITTTGNITIDPSFSASASPCELACKVRVPIQNTQANSTGNVSQYNLSTSSHFNYYRACNNGACPLDTSKGESAVLNSSGEECYCTKEFAAVATTLKAIKEAGKGMICSTGVKKP